MLTGSHRWRIDRCRFRWPWVSPNPGFKITVHLQVEYTTIRLRFDSHNCSQTSTKLRNSNFYFSEISVLLLEIWWSDFSEIFRECRGDEYLSFRKFIGSFRLKKNIRVKFLKILFGGPRCQGLAKSQKMLRSADRGSPALYKAVKIVTLWQANRHIIDVKFYLIKYSNPNFSNSGRQIFTKFSANVERSM